MIAHRKDINHDEIARMFIQASWHVIDTSWSEGKLLDMIIYKDCGDVYFVEVKNGNKKLTMSEAEFISKHNKRHIVIKCKEDAVKFIVKGKK